MFVHSSMAQVRKPTVYTRLGVPTPFDTSFALVTSPMISPLCLGIIRLTLAIYAITLILGKLIYEGIHFHSDGSYVTYFLVDNALNTAFIAGFSRTSPTCHI